MDNNTVVAILGVGFFAMLTGVSWARAWRDVRASMHEEDRHE